MKSSIRVPHANVIIWNYKYRSGNYKYAASALHEVDRMIVGTDSLISITTSKKKSSPVGQFEFRLAPTRNWVSQLTPGSWCVIMMSPNKKISTKIVDNETLKMLGRIDSIRLNTVVDPETGARKTEFVVTGVDWGSIFNTEVYIDPVNTNNIINGLSAIGHSMLLGIDGITKQSSKKFIGSTELVNELFNIWASPLSTVLGENTKLANDAAKKAAGAGGYQFIPVFLGGSRQFLLPKEVGTFLNYKGVFLQNTLINMKDVVQIRAGVLKDYNKYSDISDGFSVIDPDTLYKASTLWQLLMDNCNSTLNELVADMSVSSTDALNGVLAPTLFKRVRPFINRDIFPGVENPLVAQSVSKFANVMRHVIALEDVININAGTNWQDRRNFIEIRPWLQTLGITEASIKGEQQYTYMGSYERDGLKMHVEQTKFIPVHAMNGALDPLGATNWKYLLAEWHFNTEILLNGSLTIMGQNQYIAVGDNIAIDARVLGEGLFNSEQEKLGKNATFLAHVESISHTFSVNEETGARSFFTVINFVRGLITDAKGKVGLSFLPLSSALDSNIDNISDNGDIGPIMRATSITTVKGT